MFTQGHYLGLRIVHPSIPSTNLLIGKQQKIRALTTCLQREPIVAVAVRYSSFAVNKSKMFEEVAANGDVLEHKTDRFGGVIVDNDISKNLSEFERQLLACVILDHIFLYHRLPSASGASHSGENSASEEFGFAFLHREYPTWNSA